MKKINTKKLNQFYMSGSNSAEMKSMVQTAVETYLIGEATAISILVLQDLGLLVETN